MDQMDVDHVTDVPDTPDRLTAQNINGKSIRDRKSILSISGRLGNHNLLDGASKTQVKISDNGVRKLLERAPKSASTSCISDHRSSSNFALGDPSSSNITSIPRKKTTEVIPNQEHNHFQPKKNNKLVCDQSSALENGPHVGACKKILSCGAPGNSQAEQNGKKLLSVIRSSSSDNNAGSSITSHFPNKGKEGENTLSGFDHGNGVNCANNSQPKVTAQKRLVRNGCISPHNIARVKESVGKKKMESDGRVHLTLPEASSSPQIKVGVKEWMGEPRTSKGKGVMYLPLTVKEPEAQSTHLPSSHSVNINDIVKEVDDTDGDAFKSSEELGGWRSTRNRGKVISGLPTDTVKRGEIGSTAAISHSYTMDLDATSSQNSFLPSGRQRASHLKPETSQFDGHHPAANTLTKRKKKGFTSNSSGESSRAAMDSSDVVLLGSSGNTRKSRMSAARSRNYLGSVVPVIEVDDTSPAARGDGYSNQGSNSNDANAMARQIEADEMLARELQEQLYSELPSVGVNEMDEHLTLALQQGYDLSPGFSRRRNGSNARRSPIASSSRQSQSSSLLSLSHRGSQSRAPTLNRMTRLRNRFPGRPRTLSSVRERNSLFPEDMDVDMRMHILEALEAMSDVGVDNSLLQTQRDFNENDYEMLLALDENNHQQGGASTSQINGLPQSTVQTDNLEEACAICLDTPTIGDTIRHLPCLHKYHKDCIDPWLKRRTSCPICKSSIA